jgi:hypothetical protein
MTGVECTIIFITNQFQTTHAGGGGGEVGGAMSFCTVFHSCHPVTINSSNSQWWVLKVLFSEMDQAEIKLIR